MFIRLPYFKDICRLIAVNLNKQKADTRAIQQVVFQGNAFENNMSTDIKLSKAQISNIIQFGRFLGSLLSKLTGPLMKAVVPLAKKYFNSIRNNSCCFSN